MGMELCRNSEALPGVLLRSDQGSWAEGNDKLAGRNFADASHAMMAPPFNSTVRTSKSESDTCSNDKTPVPLPETYVATPPPRILMRGLPLTVTGSLNVNAICLPIMRER